MTGGIGITALSIVQLYPCNRVPLYSRGRRNDLRLGLILW